MPAGSVVDVHLLQERRPAHRHAPARTRPEDIVGGALLTRLVEHRLVRGGIHRLGEEPQFAGARHGRFAGHAAAHVNVLVPADVHGEGVLDLQATPGAAVAQHRPHQLQAERDRHLRPVVEAGQVRREESCEATVLEGRLRAEVHEPERGLRLADGQVPHTGVLGEGGNRLKTGGLHRPVVADRLHRPRVVTPLVAVRGVVLGDPVYVTRHVNVPPQPRTARRHGDVPRRSRRCRGVAGTADVDGESSSGHPAGADGRTLPLSSRPRGELPRP